MPLFGPRSSPFTNSDVIFLQAKWSKIKERVEGWKSGKTSRFKRITVWAKGFTKISWHGVWYQSVKVDGFSFFLAALFLEFWKRYSSEITHRWDVSNFSPEEEHPRPEYLEQVRCIFVFKIIIITTWAKGNLRVNGLRQKICDEMFCFSLMHI